MRKILWIFISILTLSYSSNYDYTVNASFLGQIGIVNVSNKIIKNRYTTRVDLRATGMAKSMSSGLVEHHTSTGVIKSGEYYTHKYTIEKFQKNKRYLKTYKFDYKRKKITKISQKWVKGKQSYKYTKVLNFFTHNDILTLYSNILRYKKKNSKHKGYFKIAAAGANNSDGKLLFLVPEDSKAKSIADDLDIEVNDVFELFLKRNYMSGGKGSLTFAIDEEGVTKKALLKSVKMLGTLTAKRVSQ